MTSSAIEPIIPTDSRILDLAQSTYAVAEALGKELHPRTLAAIRELLRTVNSYYSNLIEGHDTHPIDIDRAMKQEFSKDTRERNLQEEAKAHIEVQREMEKRLEDDSSINVCSVDFLCWLHREFYERVPVEFRIVRNPETGRTERVIPGALRSFDVKVGRHLPPGHSEVPEMMGRLGEAYDSTKYRGARALVMLSAAHHRMLWVHPFGDGNGRVMRMVSDAYLLGSGMGGHGLWTVSRGLARKKTEYLSMLEAADSPRWNDYDGRGNLSEVALNRFCTFFQVTIRDQVDYMAGLLRIDELAERIKNYTRAREAVVLPDRFGNTDKGSRFPTKASRLLIDLFYRGKISRSEIPELLSIPERSARRVVRFLIDDGFISSDTPKADLRFRIPAHAGPYFFPDLYNPSRL